MTVATSQTKKLMKLTLSLFRPRFNSSKCKTAAKMAVARIKLLRNKREVVVRQMRRDIALLLQSGQDATARIRVEHVIREQNVLAANEFIELFCELIVARITIIAKQRDCPAELKEGIASLIFSAPRCSEIPELAGIRDAFEKKYGRDFVTAATDLRPNCGVNRMLIEKLSVKTPTGEVKLKVMKEIAKEHQIEWDTTESEKELLKTPEELIEGPRAFISASSLPVKPIPPMSVEKNKPTMRSTNEANMGNMHFEDTASAAVAAAESAKQAIAAAQAAAYLANKGFNHSFQAPAFDSRLNASSINNDVGGNLSNSTGLFMPNNPQSMSMNNQTRAPERLHQSQSFGSHFLGDEDSRSIQMDDEYVRRNSYNETTPIQIDGKGVPRSHSYNNVSYPQSDAKYDEPDIKFDESDCDEEIEMAEPSAPVYPPPERHSLPVLLSHVKQDSVHQVHPKLPDHSMLVARFEALKYRK